MHLCAADCCVDNTATVEDVHRCIEKCQVIATRYFLDIPKLRGLERAIHLCSDDCCGQYCHYGGCPMSIRVGRYWN
jgi:hypothetical protein